MASVNHPPEKDSLLYAVDERPPEWMSILLGFQYVLMIVTPILVTPLVVTRAAGLSADEVSWILFASLLASGISTYIQIRRFGKVGAGYLLFIGTSAAFVACSLAAVEVGGMALVATMAVLSAPLQILFGWFLGPLRNIITPLVGGVVIMLIVVNVMPISLNVMAGDPEFPAVRNMQVAGITVLIIIALAIFGNARVRLWSPMIGIASGTLVAAVFGIVDFSSVRSADWIGLPAGSWQGFHLEFTAEVFSIYLTFALITLIGAVESLGDSMAIQQVSTRNFRKIDYERVQGGLYADGVGNAIAGALGTLPNTTYSNAISVVELTGVAARRVGMYAAGFLALLAFFPKIGALINSIPSPVVGAFLFVLVSMLFVTGVKLATSEGFNYKTGVIIGISFWTGYAFQSQLVFPDLIPDTLATFLNNGMTMGGLTAIALSFLFTLRPSGGARCNLPCRAEDLPQLQAFIDRYADKQKLNSSQKHNLHLTAEELFLHLSESTDRPDSLAVLLNLDESKIVVEFVDRTITDDLDIALEKLDQKAEPATPDELGLLLLGKLAKNMRHMKIGGVNYIRYEVE
ncbi:MAG: purine/pyrimidine permease [Opitutales bacterium]|nr:purine/pyrimidine permease [Opitutales bacterium]